MMINMCKVIILKCKFCGKLVEYNLNIFHLISERKVEYKCECGETNIIVNRRNKDINFEIGCFTCGNKHYYNLKLEDIIKDNNTLYCFSGIEICFIGCKEIGQQFLLDKEVNMKKSNRVIRMENYFNNFKVLSVALRRIYDMNKENKIGCDCGNSAIDVKVFNDRIELRCINCNSVKLIFAETEEDLNILLGKDRIMLKERNISCIDSINENNGDIKK